MTNSPRLVPLWFWDSLLCVWHSCKLPEGAILYPAIFFTKLSNKVSAMTAHGPVTIFVNKVWMACCHTLVYEFSMAPFHTTTARLGHCDRHWMGYGLQSLNYLLSGSIRKSLPTSVLEHKHSSMLLLKIVFLPRICTGCRISHWARLFQFTDTWHAGRHSG